MFVEEKKEYSSVGIAKIHSSVNNTVVTITDRSGNIISRSSADNLGFRGQRKIAPSAALDVATEAGNAAKDYGLDAVEVYINGLGTRREVAVKALQAVGLKINMIKDVTPVPHNGCRPPKRRRIWRWICYN